MVLARGRLSVILLGAAAIFFYMVLLSMTASGAQSAVGGQEDTNLDANAGDDECLDFEDESSADQQTLQNQSSLDQQSSQDTGNVDQQTLQNDNELTGLLQTLQNQEGGMTSSDAGQNGGEECIVADSVPDEPLPPTGAPVKSRAEETAAKKSSNRSGPQKKSNSDEAHKKSNSSETQKKPNSSEAQSKPNADGEAHKKPTAGKVQKKSNNNEVRKRSDQRSNRTTTVEYPGEKVRIEDRSGRVPRQEKFEAGSKTAAAPDLAPVMADDWAPPSSEEVASTGKPRYFAPNPAGEEMTLSARALGIYDVPVTSSGKPEDLDNGLIRVPETSLPWSSGAQRNVYIAGHYLGYKGTPSRLAFYNLHKLQNGDELVLKDDLGQMYKYRVSEKFAVDPKASWTMGQVRGRDMLTLQTCIPPDFGKRLIVRAQRV